MVGLVAFFAAVWNDLAWAWPFLAATGGILGLLIATLFIPVLNDDGSFAQIRGLVLKPGLGARYSDLITYGLDAATRFFGPSPWLSWRGYGACLAIAHSAKINKPFCKASVMRLIAILFVFHAFWTGQSNAQKMPLGAFYGLLTDAENRFRSDALQVSKLLDDERITYREFQEIHETHNTWLANLAEQAQRPTLGWPHSPPIGKEAKSVQDMFAGKHHLNGVKLVGKDIRWANLVGASIHSADISGNGLKADPDTFALRTDMGSVNLIGGEISYTNARQALLRNSLLVGVNFERTDLSGAVLWLADLRWAKFKSTNLTGADFWRARVAGAIFEPISKSLPDIGGFASAIGLAQLTYDQNPAGLIELRKAFVDSGFAKQARQITYALRRTARESKWEGNFADRVESVFEYVMLDLTVAYGMHPLRPLVILLVLVPVFSMFYFAASLGPYGGKIWANRSDNWINKTPLNRWVVIRQRSGRPTVREIIRLARVALWFSFFSAFRVGFREFNVGDWVAGLQRQPYVLGATGWCRTIAGFQSLVSLYLVALTVLSYFGNPFNG